MEQLFLIEKFPPKFTPKFPDFFSKWKAPRNAYHLNGIFGNFGENSNVTVHTSESFRKKGNTFRGISFFSLLPEFPEISPHLPVPRNTSEKECGRFPNLKDGGRFPNLKDGGRSPNLKDSGRFPNLKDGGRFPKRVSLQCVSLLVGSVSRRFRTQLQPCR